MTTTNHEAAQQLRQTINAELADRDARRAAAARTQAYATAIEEGASAAAAADFAAAVADALDTDDDEPEPSPEQEARDEAALAASHAADRAYAAQIEAYQRQIARYYYDPRLHAPHGPDDACAICDAARDYPEEAGPQPTEEPTMTANPENDEQAAALQAWRKADEAWQIARDARAAAEHTQERAPTRANTEALHAAHRAYDAAREALEAAQERVWATYNTPTEPVEPEPQPDPDDEPAGAYTDAINAGHSHAYARGAADLVRFAAAAENIRTTGGSRRLAQQEAYDAARLTDPDAATDAAAQAARDAEREPWYTRQDTPPAEPTDRAIEEWTTGHAAEQADDDELDRWHEAASMAYTDAIDNGHGHYGATIRAAAAARVAGAPPDEAAAIACAAADVYADLYHERPDPRAQQAATPAPEPAPTDDEQAEQIAADAVQAAWIKRREKAVADAETYLGAIADYFIDRDATQEDQQILHDAARQLLHARRNLTASRRSYGLDA
jgi:hypothetical protein